MIFSQKKFKTKGITLIEALVAISILIIGIFSGFILVTRVLSNINVIRDRLTASFLAQEGIELVRQIRDTNYLKILSGENILWNNGLNNGNYIISAEIGNSGPSGLIPLGQSETPYLKYNSNTKIFNYISGANTPFSRLIRIERLSEQEIRVQSELNWKSRSVNFKLVAEDHLFNWLPIE